MLSRSGEVKLADFGISKASTSNQTSTAAGHIKGTPAYLAPEIWRGERATHPRTDLFSLGAMLWEMVTGKRLFVGDSMASLVNQVLYGNPEEEIDQVAWIFGPLASLVRRLLDRDPAQRVQEARVVLDELRTLRRGLDAPGDLELLVHLVEAATGDDSVVPAVVEELSVPETTDDSWLRIRSMAP